MRKVFCEIYVTWSFYFLFQSQMLFFCQLMSRLDLQTVKFFTIPNNNLFQNHHLCLARTEQRFFQYSFVKLASFCRWVKSVSLGTSMTLFLPQDVCGHLNICVHKILTIFFKWGVIHDNGAKDNPSHHIGNWTFYFSHIAI